MGIRRMSGLRQETAAGYYMTATEINCGSLHCAFNLNEKCIKKTIDIRKSDQGLFFCKSYRQQKV
jgi:hypothetical protein